MNRNKSKKTSLTIEKRNKKRSKSFKKRSKSFKKSKKIKQIRKSIKLGSNRSLKKSPRQKKSLKKKLSKKVKLRHDGGKDDVIYLGDYIENIKLYSSRSFIYTLDYFRHFSENDTTKFIKQLFTFEKNGHNVIPQKYTIIGFIILLGLFDKFENVINSIKIKSISSSSDKDETDCSLKNDEEFEKKAQKQYRLLNIKKHSEDFFKNHIKDDLKDDKIQDYAKNMIGKNKIEDEYIINLISKFLFYSVCTIQQATRQYIMRHYLLCFIKLDIYQRNKFSSINSMSYTDEEEQKTIDGFLLHLGQYQTLPIIYKIHYKDRIFTTCGETTILNLLNYYFIDEKGDFIIKDTYSEKLKTFYKKYSNMKKQLENKDQTIIDWLEIVSNLEKKDIYNKEGDIHNNIKNIEYVLQTMLSNDNNTSITNMLETINPKYKFDIILSNEESIELLLNNTIRVYFYPGHGDLVPNTKEFRLKIRKDDEDNFFTLYNHVFKNFQELLHLFNYDKLIHEGVVKMINKKENVVTELKNKEEELKKTSGDLDRKTKIKQFISLKRKNQFILNFLHVQKNFVLYQYLEKLNLDDLINITSLKFVKGDFTLGIPDLKFAQELKELIFEDILLHDDINQIPNLTELKNLEILEFNKVVFLYYIPSLDGLKNLKTLSILKNDELREIPSLYDLSNLETLSISENKILKEIPNFDDLKNLKNLLILSNEGLIKIPRFDKLENLETLSITKNKSIKTISDFNRLKNLKILSIMSNEALIEIPSFDNLENLEELNISHKKIPSLDRLKNLRELMLQSLLESIPSFDKLENLVNLILLDLKIKTIPSLDKLTKLCRVEIQDSHLIKEIPSLDKLENLRILNIQNNHSLESYPNINLNTRLTSLILSGNSNIKKLPPFINLPNLKLVDFFWGNDEIIDCE